MHVGTPQCRKMLRVHEVLLPFNNTLVFSWCLRMNDLTFIKLPVYLNAVNSLERCRPWILFKNSLNPCAGSTFKLVVRRLRLSGKYAHPCSHGACFMKDGIRTNSQLGSSPLCALHTCNDDSQVGPSATWISRTHRIILKRALRTRRCHKMALGIAGFQDTAPISFRQKGFMARAHHTANTRTSAVCRFVYHAR